MIKLFVRYETLFSILVLQKKKLKKIHTPRVSSITITETSITLTLNVVANAINTHFCHSYNYAHYYI